MTVERVLAEYLGYKSNLARCGMLAPRSLDKIAYFANSFRRDFGARPVAEARRGDLKRWLVMHPEWKSPHTKHDACAVIVTAFRWAVEDGLIPHCPYSRPRDLPGLRPRQHITDAEVAELLRMSKWVIRWKKTRLQFRYALWFLWETGCRTCELYRLDWSMYDDDAGCFTLDSKTTEKTGIQRIIALPSRAWRMIRWMRRRSAGKGLVFVNGAGGPWERSRFDSLFRNVRLACGLNPKLTPYSLRHGFTVAALERGVGERQLADYLGHTSTRYIHWYGRGTRSKIDYLRDVAEHRKAE